jgi:TatA/E family protein of Tat protein translocase
LPYRLAVQQHETREGGANVFEGLLQPTHLIIVLVIALVVFGPGKLGDVGKELGRGVRNAKRSLSEIDDVKNSLKVDLDARPDAARKDDAKVG